MLDWVGRTLMLVLSGLATFALFASFTTVTSSIDPTPPRPRVNDVTTAGIEAAQRPAPGEPERAFEPETPDLAADGNVMVAVPQEAAADTNRVAHWLEALTYAVLALAGFMAAGLIVLLRIAGYLGQIARQRG